MPLKSFFGNLIRIENSALNKVEKHSQIILGAPTTDPQSIHLAFLEYSHNFHKSFTEYSQTTNQLLKGAKTKHLSRVFNTTASKPNACARKSLASYLLAQEPVQIRSFPHNGTEHSKCNHRVFGNKSHSPSIHR